VGERNQVGLLNNKLLKIAAALYNISIENCTEKEEIVNLICTTLTNNQSKEFYQISENNYQPNVKKFWKEDFNNSQSETNRSRFTQENNQKNNRGYQQQNYQQNYQQQNYQQPNTQQQNYQQNYRQQNYQQPNTQQQNYRQQNYQQNYQQTNTQQQNYQQPNTQQQNYQQPNTQPRNQKNSQQDNNIQPPSQDQNDTICIICLDKKRDTLILECGHIVSCSTCSSFLKICPVCRGKITRVVKAYF